jgi:hypothetical protein
MIIFSGRVLVTYLKMGMTPRRSPGIPHITNMLTCNYRVIFCSDNVICQMHIYGFHIKLPISGILMLDFDVVSPIAWATIIPGIAFVIRTRTIYLINYSFGCGIHPGVMGGGKVSAIVSCPAGIFTIIPISTISTGVGVVVRKVRRYTPIRPGSYWLIIAYIIKPGIGNRTGAGDSRRLDTQPAKPR